MENREPGYYWVKMSINSKWIILEYIGLEWFNEFDLNDTPEIVDENRILNPDESHERNRNKTA